jgi:cell pole-organizing protein PopZ
MEEILASIRRIISDDDANKAPAAALKAVVPPPAQPRAEAPVRAAPVPPPKPVSAPRSPAAIQNDIEAVLAEPEKPAIEPMPKVVAGGNGAAELADPDILELTEEMAAVEPLEPEPEPEMPASSFRTIDGQPDVFFAETREPEPEPEDEPAFAMPSEPLLPPQPFGYDNPHSSSSIISQATSAAVDSAFNQLAQSVFTQNGRTIEDLVKDMLRPMLKSWLDDNLPGLVERLVRAEIERVSRGR